MKTTDPKRRLHAALRTHLRLFIRKAFHTVDPGRRYEHNWHLDALAHVLEACARGEIRRLIITVPPRHMKSLCATVAFPAWLLGRDSSLRIISASYGAELSTKHSLDTRRIMESEWYQELFPATQLSAKKNTQAEITTTDGGFRYATSVQGSLTGRGGDFLIIDDPHKANEIISDVQREAVIEWANTTTLTRLDNKQTGCIILIMQRLHEGDLAGVWLDKGGWYHLNLPAIAERDESIAIGGNRYHVRRAGDVLHAAREPREVLDQIKLDLGEYAFAAQYQQRPAPLGGGLIKLEWFKRYKGKVTPQAGDYLVLSCDNAYTVSETADWTVITVWLVRPWKGIKMYILLDVVRQKLEFTAVEGVILALQRRWNASLVVVETTGAGATLWQRLRLQLPLMVTGVAPKDDKATRMMAETPAIERGEVWIPEEAPWLEAFERELVSFPNGKHDDQVDSLSQFLFAARRNFPCAAPKPLAA